MPNQQSRGGRAGGKWPLTFRGRHPRPPRKGRPREKREGAADEGLTASSQGKRRRSPELRRDAAPAPLGRPVEVPEASGAPLLFLNSVQTVSRGPLHPNTTCTCMSVLRESCPPGRYCPSTCRSTFPPGKLARVKSAAGLQDVGRACCPQRRQLETSSGPAKGKQERPSRRAAGGWVVQTLSLARSAAWQAATAARCWAGARGGGAGQLCPALCHHSGACRGTSHPPQSAGHSRGP